MGMFDSFIIERDGYNHEIQTKRFGCALDVWRKGSVVNEPTHGVNILFNEIAFNDDGTIDYIAVDNATHVLFIVLVDGIFIDYTILEIVDDVNDFCTHHIKELESEWTNTAKVNHALVQCIINKDAMVTHYKNTLGKIRSYIVDYREPDQKWRLSSSKISHLANETELLDVILDEVVDSVVNNQSDINIKYADPLDRYRL